MVNTDLKGITTSVSEIIEESDPVEGKDPHNVRNFYINYSKDPRPVNADDPDKREDIPINMHWTVLFFKK